MSLNLYTYCHNEPIMYFDPTGHNRFTNWLSEKWDDAVEGATILFDSKKRREAINLIRTHGDDDFITNTMVDTIDGASMLLEKEERDKAIELLEEHGGDTIGTKLALGTANVVSDVDDFVVEHKIDKYAKGAIKVIGGATMVAGSGVGTVASGGTASPLAIPTAVVGGSIFVEGIHDIMAVNQGIDEGLDYNILREDVFKPVGAGAGGLIGTGVDRINSIVYKKETNYKQSFSEKGAVGGDILFDATSIGFGYNSAIKISASAKTITDTGNTARFISNWRFAIHSSRVVRPAPTLISKAIATTTLVTTTKRTYEVVDDIQEKITK